ncbi:MAG: protoglobin family protein [Thermogemmata sp.]|jgi:hypothetical protein|uniref:Protoglobin family protein n=1 Tax=Thermogemmata fonticola TaxID=2755323 RepID=A0A7V9ACC7_9BACT|nr:protoglobin family protein [Thermogemmata fonticola]MBA2227136.1 protoglobin family protein [Thermogemmata fonticola]MCX8138434.1 protoglobin family protein [Gemmataceae bacterium]
MRQIDEARLERDLGYRYRYLADFIGFGPDDEAALHEAAASLAPLVPVLVDAVYDKLIQQDATWRHFLPRQHGYEGPTPPSLAELTMDHPQIRYRKQHLARYLSALVTRPYDGKMVEYLDMVGKIHTRQAGNPNIHVPQVQMNALMGFVADAVTAAIFGLGLGKAAEQRLVRAFQKLLWIQNDLIHRHYAAGEGSRAAPGETPGARSALAGTAASTSHN